MKSYSPDLRIRIVAAVDRGETKASVARRFGVALSTVKLYVVRRDQTGSLDPFPIPGPSPTIGPQDYPALVAQLDANADATLEEHCQAWERSHHVRISPSTMCRMIRRVGWTRKKSRWVPVSGIPRRVMHGKTRSPLSPTTRLSRSTRPAPTSP